MPSRSQRRKLFPVTSLVIMLTLLLPVVLTAPTVNAFANGQNAAIVIGQPDLNSQIINSSNITPNILFSPEGIAFDSSGNLWVAGGHDRVLEFRTPLSTYESASVVLGQSNLTTQTGSCIATNNVNPSCLVAPAGIAFDPSGNLWISDSGNYRIVEFKPPFTNGENASLVIGQPNLNIGGSSDSPTASNLNLANGISFDSSGNLWVADDLWNRVLEFKAPFVNGENASLVLGQDNFTSGISPNYGGTCPKDSTCPTASSLSNPSGVTVDSSGNVWTSETSLGRILEFKPPFTNGMSASLVLGQPGFTTWGTGGSGGFWCSIVTPNQFCTRPVSIAFSSSGTLWVADGGFDRVISFNPPFSNNENASIVLGRPDFTNITSPSENVSESTTINTVSLAVDSSGNVWVSDNGHDRVVEFLSSVSGGTSSSSSETSMLSTVSAGSSSTTTPLVTSSTTHPSTGGSSSFPFTSVGIGVVVVALIAISAVFLMRRGRP